MKNSVVIIFIILILSACSKQESFLERVLKTAGDNRTELEKALAHYQKNPSDSLKYQAACFLIENMVGKYYMDGKAIQERHQYMDSLFQMETIEYDFIGMDSAYQKDKKEHEYDYTILQDLQTLSAEYIIHNIEQAFDVWQKPWSKDVPFDMFCEYILPHRVGNEIPEEWRELYRERFEKVLLDSCVNNPVDAAILVNNVLKETPIHIEKLSFIPHDIRPSTLINLKFGQCENYANLAVLAMRSVGIPVSIESIPHWGRGNLNHTSNVVLDTEGNGYDFMGGEENPGEGHLIRFEGHPKIYRKTYSLQKNSLTFLCGKEKIPTVFRDPCIKDITENYSFINVQNITIDLPKKRPDNQFAYLCVFDRSEWSPVGWSKIQKNQATFNHVGPDIIYQLALYEDNQIQPIGNSFYVDSLGKVSILNPTYSNGTIELDRKHRPNTSLDKVAQNMVGGSFQASDFKDFRNAETLFTFTEPLSDKYTTIEINPGKAYTYYRYLSSDKTYNNMAEVEFYHPESGEILKGEIIGSEGASIHYPRNTKEKIFDGDPLTFYYAKEFSSWAGMAFDSPVVINKIRYIRRNDDNGIRKSNLYELLYCKDGNWISLEQKKADQDDVITFENVPSGCLYWLKNHTRGKEERPFSYENNKQVWW